MQVPVVLLGQVLPGYSCVYHDDYHAAKEMTERLAKHAGTPVSYTHLDVYKRQKYPSRAVSFFDSVSTVPS